MPYRDKEYEVNGHEIVLQQSEEGGSVVVWFDGYSGYIDRAMSHINETPVSEKVTRHLEEGDQWNAVKAMAAAMAELSVYFCKDCNSFYDSDKVKRKHFAGHRCDDCANSEKECSDNPESETHDYEIMNPHQKNNARVSTKYKCEHCGHKKQSTPTG